MLSKLIAGLFSPHLPSIYTDCDGVLANWLHATKRTVTEVGGPDAWSDDYLSSWGFVWDGTLPASIHQAVNDTMSDPDWVLNMEPMPGALKAWRKLSDAVKKPVEQLRVVTAPWESCVGWERARKQWLRREFGVLNKQVAIGGDKHLFIGDGIFIEDRVDTLCKWIQRGLTPGCRLGILINSPSHPALFSKLSTDDMATYTESVLNGDLVIVNSFAEAVDYLVGND